MNPPSSPSEAAPTSPGGLLAPPSTTSPSASPSSPSSSPQPVPLRKRDSVLFLGVVTPPPSAALSTSPSASTAAATAAAAAATSSSSATSPPSVPPQEAPSLPAAQSVLPQPDEGHEDGPVFRATLNDLERGVLGFRKKLKHVLRATTAYVESCKAQEDLSGDFLESLRELNVLLPATTYLEQAFNMLKEVRADYLNQLENLVLQPLRNMYDSNDLTNVEDKKKRFDKESAEYYVYQEKYLAMDRAKGKRSKKEQSHKDKKFQEKRANFDLHRFDYLTFMEELNTKKQQEVLYHVSSFAEKQHRYYFKCIKGLEVLKPQLDELTFYSTRSWADISAWIKDRQNIRKNIEVSNIAAAEAVAGSPSDDSPTVAANRYRGIRDLDVAADASQRPSADFKEGFLFAQSSKGNWKQVWCVLADGWFQESSTWKIDAASKPPKRVDLRFCSAREALKSERRFCFEIISPQSRRLYQASSEDDLKTWLAIIQNAIEASLERPMTTLASSSSTTSPRRSGPDKDWLRAELTKNESNRHCADCGTLDPDWCSINLGIMVCISCSGIHRSLGTHISKVRSISLDTASWTPELIEVQRALGNQVTNSVWEAQLPPERKPQASAPREEKLKFIKDKYRDRAFVLPLQEGAPDAHAQLMESVAADDILRGYHALALGADVNALSPQGEFQGRAPLHVAIERGNLVFAELILQNRGEVDIQDSRLFTSLHYAAQSGSSEAWSYLVSKGANKELRNADGQAAADLSFGSPSSSPPPLPPPLDLRRMPYVPQLATPEVSSPLMESVVAGSNRKLSAPGNRPRAISMFNSRSPFGGSIF